MRANNTPHGAKRVKFSRRKPWSIRLIRRETNQTSRLIDCDGLFSVALDRMAVEQYAQWPGYGRWPHGNVGQAGQLLRIRRQHRWFDDARMFQSTLLASGRQQAHRRLRGIIALRKAEWRQQRVQYPVVTDEASRVSCMKVRPDALWSRSVLERMIFHSENCITHLVPALGLTHPRA